MAAHLDPVNLRRHALPAHFMTLTYRLVEAPALPGRRADTARPRLVATWQPDSSGRPVCNWSLVSDDPRTTQA